MSSIEFSTAVIITTYAWYLAARRFKCVPTGPKWLRGIIGASIVCFAAYAVVEYANEIAITGWDTAFLSVTIVVLHLVIAIPMAFLLWHIDKTYWLRLNVTKQPSGDYH